MAHKLALSARNLPSLGHIHNHPRFMGFSKVTSRRYISKIGATHSSQSLYMCRRQLLPNVESLVWRRVAVSAIATDSQASSQQATSQRDLVQIEYDCWSDVKLKLQPGTSSLDCFGASRLGHFQSYEIPFSCRLIPFRSYHTSSSLWREETKVEETLEALKDTIKDKEIAASTAAAAAAAEATESKVSSPVAEKTVITAPSELQVPTKKSLWQRFVAEVKHYYHGFRLLFIDFRVAGRLIWQVLNGQPLMRREQKQLVRATADLFRLVPFLVFVVVPFAEFALPLFLKLFPDMLPSTFKEEDRELEKRRKRLKLKLEMAKFLQDTVEEMALQRKGASGESVHDFVKFMDKIRTSGVQTSNEEILKFSKLFEDEITLDNLSNAQLRALCRLVDIQTIGTSYLMRFQLEMKLRQLEADDKMIQKEGIDSLAVWELQDACRSRGMRSFGVSEQRLKSQLSQWLDLHLNCKIPTSLLLLSRALYLPEHLSAEDQLKATISVLPHTTAEEAKVKILEVTGDRVDNKSKLEVIKQEEAIIKQEKEEMKKEEEEEALRLKKAEILLEVPSEAAAVPTEELIDKATILAEKESEKIPEIATGDLSQIEDLLEHVAGSKRELPVEVDDLKALKEDITEYRESLEDVKDVVESSGGTLAGLTESKAAQRLSRKVNKMIVQMDTVVQELTSKKETLIDDIKAKKGSVDASTIVEGENDVTKKILDEINEEQHNLITITELLESIHKLQTVPDSKRFEMIAKVLDEDKDGVIDYTDAMKVIELLGKENIKMSAEQISEIMAVLRKEKEILEEEKQQKLEERKQQQQPVSDTPSGDTPSEKPKTDAKQL